MTIHWWDTDKAVEELAEGNVSEQDALYYAMIGALMYTQASYYCTWFGGSQSWLLIYECIVVAIISVVGVNECFKANGGAQGADFLKRLSIISVPVGIKVGVAGIFVGQAAYFGFPYIVTTENFRDPGRAYHLFGFVQGTAFMFIFYWRMTTHFSRLRRRQQANLPDHDVAG